MNFIKKHIKEILIAVFVLFSLNKCTQSCNRGQKIDEQEFLIINKDSCINKQTHIIDSLNRDISEYKNRLGLYEDFSNERRVSDSLNHAAQREQSRAISDLSRQVRNSKKR